MDKKEKEKLPITLCIITANSGKRIKDMILKHKKYVSEVFVIVQKSKDDTLARATEVADFVIERRNKGTADPDRNWLFNLATHSWILYLDDDEFVSPELGRKLKTLINDKVDVYWLKRTNLVNGKDVSSLLGDDYQARLFKRGAVVFPDQIHTYPKVADQAIVAHVDYAIIHDRSLELLKKGNRARNCIASKDQIVNQERFISAVENLLEN